MNLDDEKRVIAHRETFLVVNNRLRWDYDGIGQ